MTWKPVIAAFVVLIGWTVLRGADFSPSRGIAQARQPQPPQWEYLRLVNGSPYTAGRCAVLESPGGGRVEAAGVEQLYVELGGPSRVRPDGQPVGVREVAELLGREGWEMCSSLQGPSPVQEFFFKRLVSPRGQGG